MSEARTPLRWPSVPIRDIISDVRSGFAAGKRDPTGILQLRMNNVDTSAQLDFSAVIRVPLPREGICRYLLQPGDVIFNNTNSDALVGKSALFTGFSEQVTLSNHLTRLRTHRDRCEPAYLTRWLQFLWNIGIFKSICNRWIGQSAVKPNKLLSINMPFAPLPDQRRIVALLDQQMGAIACARAASTARIGAVQALRKAILSDAFCGNTPLWAEPGEPPRAPPGWRWYLLTALARLESGHTPSRNHPEWWGGDIPWLALPDIRALDGITARDSGEHINPDGITNSSARILPEATVCMCRTGSVGLVTILGRPMATSQGFANWVCGPALDPRFLLYLLTTARPYLNRLANGALVKDIYMPAIRSFRICTPPLPEQQRIAAALDQQLDTSERMMAAAEEEGALLASAPAALLSSVFGDAI